MKHIEYAQFKIDELEKAIISNEVEKRVTVLLSLTEKKPDPQLIEAKKKIDTLLTVYKLRLEKWRDLLKELENGSFSV